MRRLPFTAQRDLHRATTAAGGIARAGGVLLVPTETFYGLAVVPAIAAAVERVRAMKGRPLAMALPVLCADWSQIEALVKVPPMHRPRLELSWPGPLTAVLWCRDRIAAAPQGKLAVRIPGQPLLRALLDRIGPLTGTSANRHGAPPCTGVEEALASLFEAPDLILDGGATPGGRPSTVVDLTGGEPAIVRPGATPWEER